MSDLALTSIVLGFVAFALAITAMAAEMDTRLVASCLAWLAFFGAVGSILAVIWFGW